MKKRLMMGILAGGLMAAMLPGVAAAKGQPAGQGANACHLLADAYQSTGAGDVEFTGKYNVGNPESVRLAGSCDGGPIASIDDDLALDVSRPNGWSASDAWFPAICGVANNALAAQDVTDLFQSGTHTVTLTVVDTCGGLSHLRGPVYLIVDQHAD